MRWGAAVGTGLAPQAAGMGQSAEAQAVVEGMSGPGGGCIATESAHGPLGDAVPGRKGLRGLRDSTKDCKGRVSIQ